MTDAKAPSMDAPILYMTGAVLFGASGAVHIVADLLPGTAVLNLSGVALGLLGLPALYLSHAGRAGLAGLVAVLVLGLGLVGIAGLLFAQAVVFPQLPPGAFDALVAGPAGMTIFAFVILYVAGVAGFAATGLRADVHPKPALALWAAGTAPTIAAIALPPIVMTIAEIVAGCAGLWLSVSLWQRYSAQFSSARSS